MSICVFLCVPVAILHLFVVVVCPSVAVSYVCMGIDVSFNPFCVLCGL